mmetsp:Transcript_1029/g.2118  ORF Transcript_1029/g.2118 Transcript_1029/m.2118 type:complete len:245 (+) Transcript_1029:2-736(+)
MSAVKQNAIFMTNSNYISNNPSNSYTQSSSSSRDSGDNGSGSGSGNSGNPALIGSNITSAMSSDTVAALGISKSSVNTSTNTTAIRTVTITGSGSGSSSGSGSGNENNEYGKGKSNGNSKTSNSGSNRAQSRLAKEQEQQQEAMATPCGSSCDDDSASVKSLTENDLSDSERDGIKRTKPVVSLDDAPMKSMHTTVTIHAVSHSSIGADKVSLDDSATAAVELGPQHAVQKQRLRRAAIHRKPS